MARITHLGVSGFARPTTGSSFAGKTEATATGAVNFFSMGQLNPMRGQLGFVLLLAARVMLP